MWVKIEAYSRYLRQAADQLGYCSQDERMTAQLASRFARASGEVRQLANLLADLPPFIPDEPLDAEPEPIHIPFDMGHREN